ncbi:hypothetical protein CCAX7_25860 [Capsulimonas corticalis]|uniref:Uncharacterized protein n=1 Tax=Capsulimonas corticalis TaxID=2219043 RepID=A0A402CVU8_9BACT|nr:hypothetical protein [Capsulimonas corticalis]BDI30535.1 hypothetical protein CCAX7_25860 [Capsulimonas corticalis]
MTEIDPNTTLYDVMSGVAPSHMIERVSAWAHAERWRVGGIDLARTRHSDILDKRAKGRAIYDEYRRAHRIAVLYEPANIMRLLDAVAVKLCCENFAALEEVDSTLSENLNAMARSWADWHDEFLINQIIPEADWPKLINTFVARTIKADGWLKPLQQERWEQRKAATKPARQTDGKTYLPHELKIAIKKFLRSDRLSEYTSAQIAEQLQCRSKWQEVGRMLGELSKDPGSGVVWRHPKGKPRMMLWKYCPQRNIIKAAPERTQEIVSKWVIDYVRAKQTDDITKRSLRAIREAMRRFFGQISNDTVDNAVHGLCAEGQLLAGPGSRGGTAYSVPEDCL